METIEIFFLWVFLMSCVFIFSNINLEMSTSDLLECKFCGQQSNNETDERPYCCDENARFLSQHKRHSIHICQQADEKKESSSISLSSKTLNLRRSTFPLSAATIADLHSLHQGTRIVTAERTALVRQETIGELKEQIELLQVRIQGLERENRRLNCLFPERQQ
jgi:hypothetical protein